MASPAGAYRQIIIEDSGRGGAAAKSTRLAAEDCPGLTPSANNPAPGVPTVLFVATVFWHGRRGLQHAEATDCEIVDFKRPELGSADDHDANR
jgi:hypothetical protein